MEMGSREEDELLRLRLLIPNSNSNIDGDRE